MKPWIVAGKIASAVSHRIKLHVTASFDSDTGSQRVAVTASPLKRKANPGILVGGPVGKQHWRSADGQNHHIHAAVISEVACTCAAIRVLRQTKRHLCKMAAPVFEDRKWLQVGGAAEFVRVGVDVAVGDPQIALTVVVEIGTPTCRLTPQAQACTLLRR